jgi:hypothetical protein
MPNAMDRAQRKNAIIRMYLFLPTRTLEQFPVRETDGFIWDIA